MCGWSLMGEDFEYDVAVYVVVRVGVKTAYA